MVNRRVVIIWQDGGEEEAKVESVFNIEWQVRESENSETSLLGNLAESVRRFVYQRSKRHSLFAITSSLRLSEYFWEYLRIMDEFYRQ